MEEYFPLSCFGCSIGNLMTYMIHMHYMVYVILIAFEPAPCNIIMCLDLFYSVFLLRCAINTRHQRNSI